jgi:N utilization substance protein A
VAVAAHQEGIDPVGCCVGLRGIRIQNIVNELNGEKIDVVMWSPDAATFIANALSPAKILNVELNKEEGVATVVVPDRQLSLAIGKEGQNVRLAAKLTGWRIDIKSASAAEAEKVAVAQASVEAAAEKAAVGEEVPAEISESLEPALAGKVAEPSPALEAASVPSPVSLEPPTAEKPRLRFAEDILAFAPTKPQTKTKKRKKKGSQGREGEEEKVRGRKPRREREIFTEDEEEY